MLTVSAQSHLSAQPVSSAVQLQLGCNTSAMCQLRSAAIRQLSCNMKAQLQFVRSAATRQLSCTLLAQMKLAFSAATCWLRFSLSPRL